MSEKPRRSLDFSKPPHIVSLVFDSDRLRFLWIFDIARKTDPDGHLTTMDEVLNPENSIYIQEEYVTDSSLDYCPRHAKLLKVCGDTAIVEVDDVDLYGLAWKQLLDNIRTGKERGFLGDAVSLEMSTLTRDDKCSGCPHYHECSVLFR